MWILKLLRKWRYHLITSKVKLHCDSTLPANSHACRLKTLISRLRNILSCLVEKCELLLLIQETESPCKMSKWWCFAQTLWFTCMIESPYKVQSFSWELQNYLEIFGGLKKSMEIFGYSCMIFENPGTPRKKNLTPLNQKKLVGIQYNHPIVPLSPNNDQCLISPYSICIWSNM